MHDDMQQSSFKKARGARTAKSASPGSDDEMFDDDRNIRRSITPSDLSDEEQDFRRPVGDSPPHKRKRGNGTDDVELESRPSSFSTADRDLLIAIDRRLRALEDMLTKKHNSNKINVLHRNASNGVGTGSRTCTVRDEDKITIKEDNSFFSDGGVDFQLLTGATPDKYALNLMDSLFMDDEMRGRLFFKSARSKSTRELLPLDRVKKLLAAVAARFGKEETRKCFDIIQKKCNQKCRDKDKSESTAKKENLLSNLDL